MFSIIQKCALLFQVDDNNDLRLCLMLRTEDEDNFHTINPTIPKDS